MQRTEPPPFPEAVSVNRRRFAVVLVPVPEGSDVDGEVEVLPFQGVSTSQGYLPLVSPGAAPSGAHQPSVLPQFAPRPSEARVEAMRDLRPLKRSVALLPANHPLRFALRGEPDWLPHEEAKRKLLEWVKYVDWKAKRRWPGWSPARPRTASPPQASGEPLQSR